MDIGAFISRRLREAREEQGLSIRQLAKRSGLPTEQLSRAERGISEPSFRTLARVCDGLGVSIGEFFGGSRGSTSSVAQRFETILERLAPSSQASVARAFEDLVDALTAGTERPQLRAAEDEPRLQLGPKKRKPRP